MSSTTSADPIQKNNTLQELFRRLLGVVWERSPGKSILSVGRYVLEVLAGAWSSLREIGKWACVLAGGSQIPMFVQTVGK